MPTKRRLSRQRIHGICFYDRSIDSIADANGKRMIISGLIGDNQGDTVIRVTECITEALKCQPDMQRIATLYANRPSVFFLGRGLDYAAALEASLKLKEISYIHSEAYAAGELKHGTISLIEDGTLVVALATQPALFEKTVSNIREVVARGASVVLVTTDDFTGDESVCQHIIRLPKCLYEFSASLSIIPMQLFAYYVAVERNCDVDKPRNLAKSVTVE